MWPSKLIQDQNCRIIILQQSQFYHTVYPSKENPYTWVVKILSHVFLEFLLGYTGFPNFTGSEWSKDSTYYFMLFFSSRRQFHEKKKYVQMERCVQPEHSSTTAYRRRNKPTSTLNKASLLSSGNGCRNIQWSSKHPCVLLLCTFLLVHWMAVKDSFTSNFNGIWIRLRIRLTVCIAAWLEPVWCSG